MTSQGAQRAVVISALTVFGIYVYRVVSEGTGSSKGGSSGFGQLIGLGAPANIARFATGWGFSFLILSMITEAAPSLGGPLAIAVGASDFLTNIGQVAKDISTINQRAGAQSPSSGNPAVGSASSQSLSASQAKQLVQKAPALKGGNPSGGRNSSASDVATFEQNAAAIVATAPPLIPTIPQLGNILG